MALSVLLIGAGGSLGTPLLAEFVRQKAKFSRIAVLASDPSKKAKFAEVKKNGVDVVVGSFLEASSYKGFDVVISLVGNALLRLQPAMIEMAIAGGVKHFYPSEFGYDLSQEGLYTHRYFRSKQDTRDHLTAKASENPDFHYTLFMNGGFTEWILSPMVGVDVENHTANVYGYPNSPISVTSILDICKSIVESVLLPSPNQKREFRVAGSTQTYQELINTLGRIQGTKYQCTYTDPVEGLKKSAEAWRSGEGEAEQYSWALKTLPTGGYASLGNELDNGLLGFVPETAEQTFRRIFVK